jgi:hypothetical protein
VSITDGYARRRCTYISRVKPSIATERSAISLYFNRHPSARRSFLEAVQPITGPESCITPAATPAAYALEDQPALVGSNEVARRTCRTVLAIDNRACETTSITGTLDSYLLLGSEVEGLYQDAQNPGTGQHCAEPLSSPDADPLPDPFPDPFAICDDLRKYSYTHSLPIRPGTSGSDRFGTRSLQHSERRTAEALTLLLPC